MSDLSTMRDESNNVTTGGATTPREAATHTPREMTPRVGHNRESSISVAAAATERLLKQAEMSCTTKAGYKPPVLKDGDAFDSAAAAGSTEQDMEQGAAVARSAHSFAAAAAGIAPWIDKEDIEVAMQQQQPEEDDGPADDAGEMEVDDERSQPFSFRTLSSHRARDQHPSPGP